MILFPYVPQPYPDEILGSWIQRIRRLNSSGAWSALKKEIGISIEGKTFDFITYSPSVENLLNVLGTNYSECLMQLTTYPYWMAFDSIESRADCYDENDITRRLLGRDGRPYKSLKNVGLNGTYGEGRQHFYCPECLLADFEKFGEPYWHRAHHLPNIFTCFIHECELRSRCPECAYVISASSQREIGLPKLFCKCGCDLRSISDRPSLSKLYRSLINISVSALKNKNVSWDRWQVRNYLRQLLESPFDSIALRLEETMLDAFSNLKRRTDYYIAFDLIGFSERNELRFKRNFKNFSAPDVCGLLVALGVGFRNAALNFVKENSYGKSFKKDWERRPLSHTSIEQVRLKIEARVADMPHRPVTVHKPLYWFLRIFDADWIAVRFPELSMTPFPTIPEDRISVSELLSDDSVPYTIRSRDLLQKVAPIRASLRDAVWYESQVIKFRGSLGGRGYNNLIESRCRLLQEMVGSILSAETVPLKITAKLLGENFGITEKQAYTAITIDANLRQMVRTANNDLKRRRLIFFANQIRAEGLQLSATSLIKRANLPGTAEEWALTLKIIKEFD